MNNYIPNTSAIPNILLDYWIEHLQPKEFKILMCIARKTYCYHKEVDISIEQIVEMTGLSKYLIIKKLDKLKKIGLINEIRFKSSCENQIFRFEINVNLPTKGHENE